MRYVTYNQNGQLDGFYNQELSDLHAQNFIEITEPLDEHWTRYIANMGRDGLELLPVQEVIPSVPLSVTMRQARLALLGAGVLSNVDAAIDSLPSPQKEAAQIEWDYSSVVERNRPLVQALGPLLGLTEEQLDQLFITAATL